MNQASLLDCGGFYFSPKQMPDFVEILLVYRMVSNCLKSYFLMSHVGFIYHGVKMQIHALINLTSSRTFENNYSHLKMHTVHGLVKEVGLLMHQPFLYWYECALTRVYWSVNALKSEYDQEIPQLHTADQHTAP